MLSFASALDREVFLCSPTQERQWEVSQAWLKPFRVIHGDNYQRWVNHEEMCIIRWIIISAEHNEVQSALIRHAVGALKQDEYSNATQMSDLGTLGLCFFISENTLITHLVCQLLYYEAKDVPQILGPQLSFPQSAGLEVTASTQEVLSLTGCTPLQVDEVGFGCCLGPRSRREQRHSRGAAKGMGSPDLKATACYTQQITEPPATRTSSTLHDEILSLPGLNQISLKAFAGERCLCVKWGNLSNSPGGVWWWKTQFTWPPKKMTTAASPKSVPNTHH